MLELRDVSFSYDGGSTVRNVSLKVERGEFVAVIGANGAGKSTVSKLLRGLIRPDSGSVLFDGIDLATVRASSLAARVGFLFQNPDRQICKSTVQAELEFSMQAAGGKGDCQAVCERLLEEFELVGGADPFSLSRGERQRVALASVLVTEPSVLILDEPTTGLDYRECCRIMDYVRALNQRGVTVVMVTHDMEIVLDYAERVVMMADGSVVADGAPLAVFADEALMQRAAVRPPQLIGLAALLPARFHGLTAADELAAVIESEVRGV